MSSKRRSQRVLASIEALEGRQLFSAAAIAPAFPTVTKVNVAGGVALEVSVTGGEQVTVNQSASGITVNCNGAYQTYAGSFVELLGTCVSGNNRISLSNTVKLNVVLQAGSGSDTLIAGGGMDSLYAGTGADLLKAGNGTDTLVSVGDSKATLEGGNGVDSFWDTSGDVVTNVNEAGTTLNEVHTVPSSVAGAASFVEPAIGIAGDTYKSFAGDPLFSAAGPSANDVVQGDLGDCYFLASLSAIAQTDPNQIRQDIVQLSDGSYLVQFQNNGQSVYEHVDATLPATSGGNPVYAQLGAGKSMWVAVMEKAFAMFRNGADSYQNLGSGWMSEVYSDLGVANTNTFFESSASSLLTMIQTDLSAGEAVTVGIADVPAGAPLIGDHAYSVVSVQTDSNGNPISVTLRNPWGISGIAGYVSSNGDVTVTAAQLFAANEGFTAGLV